MATKVEKNSIPNLNHKLEIIERWANLDRSGSINKLKETALQGFFLKEIFSEVLGYQTATGNSKIWNLNQEQSTAGGKFADGSLGFFTENLTDVRVVIELKDATTNLDEKQHKLNDLHTPVEQAFGYQHQVGKKCNWVIVSNFKEIRLYHHKSSSEYEVFNIAELTEWENFRIFWFLLSYENLINPTGTSIIDTLFEKNEADELQISKELYSTYKKIRLNLFEHLKQHNPGKPELMLLEKTQKILDRFIFISFCEDNHLLPDKVFKSIIESGKKSFMLLQTKIWSELKGLFAAINQGSPPHNINKFNGGLFATDEDLDSLEIRDSILEDMSKLSEYDYESDVDVNILGHIFEQSISDIEELKAGIEKKDFDKSKSKRKKEGIFYTPEYITRYIVENAVGGWLEDRKIELGFYELPELTDSDKESILQRIKKPALKISYNAKKHLDFWEAYREKLRNIKVLDPACGSGAFLNQAFNYLYAEGQKVNDKITELSGGQHEIFQIDKHILTNNLYGVDLNRESVEITKLSLWIKTANKYSELTALDDNIKCGNSLIDDPAVAGEKAFNWFREFPTVFPGYRDYSKKTFIDEYESCYKVEADEEVLYEREEEKLSVSSDFDGIIVSEPSYSYKVSSKGFEKHGFDVVIGNPPYVNSQKMNDNEKKFYYQNYESSIYQINLYLLFIERSINLLRNKGYFSFIVPNTWLINLTLKEFRKKLLNEISIHSIADLTKKVVFDDAVVLPIIFLISKNKKNEITIKEYTESKFVNKSIISSGDINEQNNYLINYQISTDYLTIIKKMDSIKSLSIEDFSKVSFGVKFYQVNKGIPKQTRDTVENQVFSHAFKVNEKCKMVLEGKDIERYYLNWGGNWIEYGPWLAEPRNESLFTGERILVRRIVNQRFSAIYTDDNYCNNSLLHTIKIDDSSIIKPKYLLALFNSTLYGFYFIKKYSRSEKTFPEIRVTELKELPIPYISTEAQQPFIERVDTMLAKNIELQEVKNIFINLLKDDFNIDKLSTKLKNWFDISWAVFTSELKKLKIELRGEAKEDWAERFNRLGVKAREIKQTIDSTDKEIDRMVYKLYSLTEEEIMVVEGNGFQPSFE